MTLNEPAFRLGGHGFVPPEEMQVQWDQGSNNCGLRKARMLHILPPDLGGPTKMQPWPTLEDGTPALVVSRSARTCRHSWTRSSKRDVCICAQCRLEIEHGRPLPVMGFIVPHPEPTEKPEQPMNDTISFTKTLYARNSNGSVQVWTIEASGDKTRTVAGRHGGQMITSAWTKCTAKNVGASNEVSAANQAIKEAKAKAEKKEKEGYSPDIHNIDVVNFIQVMTCLEYGPKIVKKIKAALDNGEGVWVQPKVDGYRAVPRPHIVQSRGNIDMPACRHVRTAFSRMQAELPDVLPDGEAYNHAYWDRFGDLQSLVSKKKPTAQDLADAEREVQFHWFDIVPSKEDELLMPFGQRWERLVQLYAQYAPDLMGKVVLVPTHQVTSLAQILELFDYFLGLNYEGIIIRLDRPYERREKAPGIFKWKPHRDEEFLIKDIIPGKGSREEAAKLVCAIEDDLTFDCALKCPVEKMKEIYANKGDYIGQYATVRYGGREEVPRKPGVRPRWPRAVAIRGAF